MVGPGETFIATQNKYSGHCDHQSNSTEGKGKDLKSVLWLFGPQYDLPIPLFLFFGKHTAPNFRHQISTFLNLGSQIHSSNNVGNSKNPQPGKISPRTSPKAPATWNNEVPLPAVLPGSGDQ